MRDCYFLVVVSAVVCTVWSEAESQDCSNADDIMRCLNSMPPVTQDMTGEELDRVCLGMDRGLQCVDSYTRRCMTEEMHDNFHRLHQSTKHVYQKLCRQDSYREEFLVHAPCMKQAKDEHEYCVSKYEQRIGKVTAKTNEQDRRPANETSPENDSGMRTVCCSFRDYLVCTQRIVMEKCGEQTAKFAEDFWNQMSFSLMQGHCERYPHGSDQCQGSSASRNSPLALLLPVSLAIISLYALRPT